MIHDLYFSGSYVPTALSAVSRKYVDRIRQFVRGDDTSPIMQRRVRRSILLAQKQVEKEMEGSVDMEDAEELKAADKAVLGEAYQEPQPPSSAVFEGPDER